MNISRSGSERKHEDTHIAYCDENELDVEYNKNHKEFTINIHRQWDHIPNPKSAYTYTVKMSLKEVLLMLEQLNK